MKRNVVLLARRKLIYQIWGKRSGGLKSGQEISRKYKNFSPKNYWEKFWVRKKYVFTSQHRPLVQRWRHRAHFCPCTTHRRSSFHRLLCGTTAASSPASWSDWYSLHLPLLLLRSGLRCPHLAGLAGSNHRLLVSPEDLSAIKQKFREKERLEGKTEQPFTI